MSQIYKKYMHVCTRAHSGDHSALREVHVETSLRPRTLAVVSTLSLRYLTLAQNIKSF